MPPPRRWQTGPSILSVLRAWDGTERIDLPDEELPEPNEIRYASGAQDGIATHHIAGGGDEPTDQFLEGVRRAFERGKEAGMEEWLAALYELLRHSRALAFSSALIHHLIERRASRAGGRALARLLVREAVHREPLKFGIVLLGASGTEEDIADLTLLARHDEFTLYAVVAAANLLEDPTDLWLEMARNVRGWGKVHAVEWLARRVENRPDIRAWLLREGCENEVGPEYLAYICATAGDLAGALSADRVDDELLDGACVIVAALIGDGPVRGMEGYTDGVVAVQSLVSHLTPRCDSLRRLSLFRSLLRWLDRPTSVVTSRSPVRTYDEQDADDTERRAAKWAQLGALGWTDGVRADLAGRCEEVLLRPEWPERVRAAYDAGGAPRAAWDDQVYLAWKLAPAVGVDLWEAAFARLAHNPIDAWLYQALMRTDDRIRRRRVVKFAETHLPLANVATGPQDCLGLGLRFRAHDCLDQLVPQMRRRDVFSERLVATTLRSPVTRNRNAAIRLLEIVPPEGWGELVSATLRKTLADEPRDDVRERLGALVARLA